MDAEKGAITPNQLRKWCGISPAIYPKKLIVVKSPFTEFNKWGVPHTIPNLSSAKGLRIKYPHTPFFRNSPGGHVEEKRENGIMPWESLCNKDIVFTLKMDGSNVTFDNRGVAARNAHDAPHPSFAMVKSMHAVMRDLIPDGVQIFGEWLYAKHSIHYIGDLALNRGYLQLFAVYDHNHAEWASWASVKDWAQILNVSTTPTLYEMYNEHHQGYPLVPMRISSARDLEREVKSWGDLVVRHGHEGIVVRSMYSYPFNEFDQNVAKYVRTGHVTTSKHWSQEKMIRNEAR
jgi:hypothetical protein